jgi:hypothetical protein
MRNKNKNNWKDLDKELLDPIADKLTSFVDYLTPERKDRDMLPPSKEEEDAYFKELDKKRKARYEVLKEKYKD